MMTKLLSDLDIDDESNLNFLAPNYSTITAVSAPKRTVDPDPTTAARSY